MPKDWRFNYREHMDTDAIDAIDALVEIFDDSHDKRDLIMYLGGLIKAMNTNPRLLKSYIDKEIDIATDRMIQDMVCPECGGSMYEGKDQRIYCEACDSVYDGY